MKKFVEDIQKNATDEQKIFYAAFASLSVGVLLFFIWFASLNNKIYMQKAPTNNDLKENLKEELMTEKQEASALKSLGSSFFDITSKNKEGTKEKTEEFKREPFKLEI